MSVVICKSRPALPFLLEKEGIPTAMNSTSVALAEPDTKHEEPPEQSDIWSMIQSQKADTPPASPYVHPLMRRSSSLMSQKSLEMCTESLGSETGSEDFSSFSEDEEEEDEMVGFEEGEVTNGRKELSSVNYHSISRKSQPPRSFPPPLSSISRRDGPCVQMRPHRREGRLVMEAVPVPSQNYLHARRQDGRLLLTFVDATAARRPFDQLPVKQQQDLKQEEEVVQCEEEDEEEEEEVEVVDRGTVVEVTVTTPPKQQTGAARVHRSSLVINKFVGGAPLTNQNRWLAPPMMDSRPPSPPQRRVTTTTTAAAAAVAASSASPEQEMGERAGSPENKLLFTSKRRNREEMLHHMRRCSELRRPLFFWEPGCIATS